MSVRVRVPATTSNLGGGFDCIGAAVDRHLELVAEIPGSGGIAVERRGTLRALSLAPERDFLYTGFAAACRRTASPVPPHVALRATSDIPVGRGLGSSAAAIIAGAAAAIALLDLPLDDAALVAIGAELEGHPDNAAPAVHGGAVLAVHDPTGALVLAPLVVHRSLRFVFAVPEFTVDTGRARAALPAELPHVAARRAAAAGAALVAGLERGDAALLAAGLDGPLHIPYRRALVPGYDAVCAAAAAAGAFGATLSGSGSAIVAVAPVERASAVADAMRAAWSAVDPRVAAFVSAPGVRGYAVERNIAPDAVHSSLEASS